MEKVTIKVYDSKTGEGIEVPVSAFGMKKARGFIRKTLRLGHEVLYHEPSDNVFNYLYGYEADYEADIFFCDADDDADFPICDCDVDEECPECTLFDDDCDDEDNCSCDNKRSRFFQEHGSCEWCFFIG